MLEKFYPKMYVKNIKEIPYKKLYSKNIKNLIFDIDNTIVGFNVCEPNNEIVSFFEELKNKGFKICLLSNNNKKRVELFNKKLGLLAVYDAHKPTFRGLNKALKLLESNNKNTAIIGDQIFTDVLVGNRKNIYTILVKPISKKDEFFVKLKRYFEKIILIKYEKNYM